MTMLSTGARSRAHAHSVFAIACVALSTIASACSTSTQLLVSIDSDLMTDVAPRVAGDHVLRAVRVEVCEIDCDRVGTPRDRRFWAVMRSTVGERLPLSFGVAPRDPALPGQVELRVDALEVEDELASGDAVLFTVRRTVAFVPGRKIEVPIFLSAGCVAARCPLGTSCGDDGQCVPIGTLDAGTSLDAGRDAQDPRDAPLVGDGGPEIDAGIDASMPEDAFAPDARELLDVGTDAGPPACDPWMDATFPGRWIASSVTGFSGGWVRDLARGAGDAVLTTGTYQSSGTFTWDGASSTAAHFVGRESTSGRWTTFATFDRGSFTGYTQFSRVVEHAGVVYVAGTADTGWTASAAGGSVTLADMPPSSPASTRVGVFLFALDAETGRPRWVRWLKTTGAQDWVDGLDADDAGVWLAFRSFPPTSDVEIGSLSVNGSPYTIDRGPTEGHVRLARFDTAGTLAFVHALGGIAASGLDVRSLPGGDALVVLGVSYLAGHASIEGLTPPPPAGEMVVTRLDASGTPRWSSAMSCADGSWLARYGQLSVVGSRAFLGFSAGTASGSSVCTSLRVRDPLGEATGARVATTTTWAGVTSFDVCDGSWTGDLFTMGTSSPTVLSSISADDRAVAITGYVGPGGIELGSRTVTGHEPTTGDGSDGFAFVLSPSLEVRYTRLFGGVTDSPLRGGDDYGSSIEIVGPDRLFLTLGMTATDRFDALDVPSGARRVTFEFR